MSTQMLQLQDVYLAQQTIRPYCIRTKMISSSRLSAITGGQIFLKLETLQPIGAFKIRGAANKIAKLSSQERAHGVITASTGNHGRAVAYIANQMGIPATICISEEVPGNKVEAIRTLGAKTEIYGRSQDDAFERAAELQQQEGRILVHPFDDLDIIAGQATIGLELIEDLPDLDAVLVPVSGGGLISGIALTLKKINPAIRVIGVSMMRGPVMYYSLKAGKPILLPEEETLADSLRGGIGLENKYTFQIVQNYVDGVLLVTEADIAAAMAFLLTEHGLVVEGAGAVGVAALMSSQAGVAGGNTAVILSGKNIQTSEFLSAVTPFLDRNSDAGETPMLVHKS